jgi:pimeloyl-ACP methyl ester carboxylesterase
MRDMDIRPFRIAVEQSVLDDLRARLDRRRHPRLPRDDGWTLGTSADYLDDLVAYWRTGYDWRAHEAELNQRPQFIATLDGCKLHFIHTRAKSSRRLPLLLLHGWPDTFLRYQRVIPLLSEFDLVVPSLPGFGFSSPLPRTESEQPLRRSARLLRRLMTDVLGHTRFGVVGGDTGAVLAQCMAIEHPENVAAIHITDLGWYATNIDASKASREEQKYLAAARKHFMHDGAYVAVQTTRPQSLAVGLEDSPAGLASWIVDRFHSWAGTIDDALTGFTRDELLTDIMLYWVTGTVRSSLFTYYTEARSPSLGASDRVRVAVALALFPNDVNGVPPRSLADRTLNVQRWTEMPRGGHFAALEEPELFASDVAAFFGGVNAAE